LYNDFVKRSALRPGMALQLQSTTRHRTFCFVKLLSVQNERYFDWVAGSDDR